MKKVIPFTFIENVIPFRCRKFQRTEFADQVEIEIQEVSAVDAPIAIIERDILHDDPFNYRWFNGRLWSHLDGWRREERRIPEFKDFNRDMCGYNRNLEDTLTAIREWSSDHLLIDGTIYAPIGEPRYVIMTFGLGHNHGLGGGTALCSADRYFPINALNTAVQEAERIALARGDTKALPIEPGAKFEILIPAAIRLNPRKEHGNGDEFINQIESLIQAAPDSVVAGLGMFALAARVMKKA